MTTHTTPEDHTMTTDEIREAIAQIERDGY